MLAVVALIVALLAAFPTTRIGRTLHRLMVEQTARRLNRITPGRAVFYTVMVLAGLAFFGLFEIEGLRLFGMMAPELVLWFAMFDVALFLDVALIAAALGATSRVRAGRAAMVRAIRQIWTPAAARPAPRPRAPGTRRPARPDPKSSVEPDPAGFVFA